MSIQVGIRQVAPSDARVVTALLREVDCDVDKPSAHQRLVRSDESEQDVVFLAEVETHAVGLIGMHPSPLLHRDLMGRIAAFIVTKAYRDCGIGTRLLAAAEAWALDRDCKQIEFNSGDHHASAHGFCERQGYRVDDRRFAKEEFSWPGSLLCYGMRTLGLRGTRYRGIAASPIQSTSPHSACKRRLT